MTAGEFVVIIRADKSQLNKTLDESEKELAQEHLTENLDLIMGYVNQYFDELLFHLYAR